MVVAAASAIDAVPRLIDAYRKRIGARITLSERNRTSRGDGLAYTRSATW
jgi:hypothetical protein